MADILQLCLLPSKAGPLVPMAFHALARQGPPVSTHTRSPTATRHPSPSLAIRIQHDSTQGPPRCAGASSAILSIAVIHSTRVLRYAFTIYAIAIRALRLTVHIRSIPAHTQQRMTHAPLTGDQPTAVQCARLATEWLSKLTDASLADISAPTSPKNSSACGFLFLDDRQRH